MLLANAIYNTIEAIDTYREYHNTFSFATKNRVYEFCDIVSVSASHVFLVPKDLPSAFIKLSLLGMFATSALIACVADHVFRPKNDIKAEVTTQWGAAIANRIDAQFNNSNERFFRQSLLVLKIFYCCFSLSLNRFSPLGYYNMAINCLTLYLILKKTLVSYSIEYQRGLHFSHSDESIKKVRITYSFPLIESNKNDTCTVCLEEGNQMYQYCDNGHQFHLSCMVGNIYRQIHEITKDFQLKKVSDYNYEVLNLKNPLCPTCRNDKPTHFWMDTSVECKIPVLRQTFYALDTFSKISR